MDTDPAVYFMGGVDAYYHGLDSADNPHPVGSIAAEEWAFGWQNEREAEEYEFDQDDDYDDYVGQDPYPGETE